MVKTNTKRILVLFPSFPSVFKPDSHTFFYQQIKNLASFTDEFVFDVVVYFSVWEYVKNWALLKMILKGRKECPHNIDLSNVNIIYFWYLGYIRSKYLTKTLRCLSKKIYNKIWDKNYSLIHAHFPSTALIAYYLSYKIHTKYIITEHLTPMEFPKFLNVIKMELIRNVYLHASEIIAVSPSISKIISETLDINKDIVIIPNGISLEDFTLKEVRKDNDFRILFIGRLIEQKGLPQLLEAFKTLYKTDSSIHLSIIGTGKLLYSCYELQSNIQYAKGVHVFGAIPNTELSKIITMHDLLVLPSETESFGLVVIEANACGLPVVATRCGGPEFIITEKFQGILIEDNKVQTIINGIMDVKSNYGTYSHQRIRDFI